MCVETFVECAGMSMDWDLSWVYTGTVWTEALNLDWVCREPCGLRPLLNVQVTADECLYWVCSIKTSVQCANGNMATQMSQIIECAGEGMDLDLCWHYWVCRNACGLRPVECASGSVAPLLSVQGSVWIKTLIWVFRKKCGLRPMLSVQWKV